MKHAREDYNRIQDPENKIPEDEPVFLLRGQDRFAAGIVREYGNLVKPWNKELSDKALAHADLMDKWKNKKLPDL